MPRRKRDTLKKAAGYALRNLERAQQQILNLKAEFDTVEEQYSQLAEAVLVMIEQSINTFESFCISAWGGVPEKIERWTQSGDDWYRLRRKGNLFDAAWCCQCADWIERGQMVEGQSETGKVSFWCCPRCSTPLLLQEQATEREEDNGRDE